MGSEKKKRRKRWREETIYRETQILWGKNQRFCDCTLRFLKVSDIV